MSFDNLVECELQRVDWSQFMEANGPATNIPDTFRRLLSARTPEDANAAYWEIENHAFVQGGLFEASLPLVPVILSALVDMNRPRNTRIQLLEILYHIVSGVPHLDEVARGLHGLGDQCKAAARDGLWVLYSIFQEGVFWSAASEIIERIDRDPMRLRRLRELNAGSGRIDIPQRLTVPKESSGP
ncbi:MAG: hypothetical protein WCJ09_05640 [Planctomycetota bacterium]